jgi:putative transposase
MKDLTIQSVIQKKRKQSTFTPSVMYPNRLKRKFHATAPQQKLVTDITYISDGRNFHYLSVIQDLFNNEIVAWQLSERNDVQLVLNTVKQWTNKRDVSEAVLHSDQDFQYTSQADRDMTNSRRLSIIYLPLKNTSNLINMPFLSLIAYKYKNIINLRYFKV